MFRWCSSLLRRPRRPRTLRRGARGHGPRGGHLHDAPPVICCPLAAAVCRWGSRVLHRASRRARVQRAGWLTRSPSRWRWAASRGVLTYSRRVISAISSRDLRPIRRAALARFWLDDSSKGSTARGPRCRRRSAGGPLPGGRVVNVLSRGRSPGRPPPAHADRLPQDYCTPRGGLLLLLIGSSGRDEPVPSVHDHVMPFWGPSSSCSRRAQPVPGAADLGGHHRDSLLLSLRIFCSTTARRGLPVLRGGVAVPPLGISYQVGVDA